MGCGLAPGEGDPYNLHPFLIRPTPPLVPVQGSPGYAFPRGEEPNPVFADPVSAILRRTQTGRNVLQQQQAYQLTG